MSHKIEVINSGDWVEIKRNNKVYFRGHSIPVLTWVNLLYECNCDVVYTERRYDEDEIHMDINCYTCSHETGLICLDCSNHSHWEERE